MNDIEEEVEQTVKTADDAESLLEEEPKKPFSDAIDWVSSIVFAICAMLVLNMFFFRSITVAGPSMLDTLEDGDRVVTFNFCYTPKHGDIVVIQANKLINEATGLWGEPIIKRVIAVEGDTIMIDFSVGEVYLNGELLKEDYIKDLTFVRYNDTWIESGKEYTVPENCVFVLGDNRPVSNDSRNLPQVGFVDKSMIMGKAFVRVSPIDKFKWL
ncbi:MAG: signal peptidase I [Oscillospiraceae bacterium]|nr:signal peptidase I [Oscillospiraceae bacterium]